METLHSTIFASPVGRLFLAASDKGLVALEFDARRPGQKTIRLNPRDLRAESQKLWFEESGAGMAPYIHQLEEYFAGTRREFTFPLDIRGTEFQRACWRGLRTDREYTSSDRSQLLRAYTAFQFLEARKGSFSRTRPPPFRCLMAVYCSQQTTTTRNSGSFISGPKTESENPWALR